MKKIWPWLTILIVLAATVYQLRSQGRLWRCACGRVLLWTSEAWSAETSQHFLDPYSFTHVLHGIAFCGLLALITPRLPALWRLTSALFLEALWEVIENAAFIIERYRETTAALGYEGDTIINSLGDVLACAAGFLIALRLGLWRSLILFALVEIVLLIWIRDGLLLNLLLLIYPVEALKNWQAGHG